MENNEYQFDFSDESINEIVAKCKTGDEVYYSKLIKIFEPLVASIVKKYISYGDYYDLMQCGWLGLTDAVNNFDATKETKFSTYAYYLIKGSILKEINQNSSTTMSQGFRQLVLKIRHIINDYSQNNYGNEPTDEQIKDLLGDEKIKLETISLARYAQLDTYSLDSTSDDSDDNRSIFEKQATSTSPLEEIENIEEEDSTKYYVFNSGLDERELFIVTSKNGVNDEKKIYKTSELANIMNISDSRVMQLYRRAIVKIKKHMSADGIKVTKRPGMSSEVRPKS